METKSLYIVVGSFILASIIGAIGFSFWLNNTKQHTQIRPYIIYFDSSINGLSIGSPVKFQGIHIGSVEAIHIDFEDRIKVHINIEKSAPINSSSVASLGFGGITGESYIEITPGLEDKSPLEPKHTGEPPVIRSTLSTMDQITHSIPDILKNVSRITEQMQKIFSDKNKADTQKILENLVVFTDALAKAGSVLEKSTQEIPKTLQQFSHTLHAIETLAKGLEPITTQTTQDISKAAQEVSAMIAENRPGIRDFTNTTLYEGNALVVQLRKSLETFDIFLKNLDNKIMHILPDATQKGYRLQ